MSAKNSNTATKKTIAPKGARKPKQQTLGKEYERKKIDEVEDAAEDYRQTRDEWMALQGEMAEKQVKLDELLAKHNIKKYLYLDDEGDELEVYIPDKKPLAKVRRVKNAKAKSDE